MALIRFRSTVWDNPVHQPLLKYVSAALLLGEPARFQIGPGAGQEWTIFDDTHYTLDQFAYLGALAAFDLDDLPVDWELPTVIGEDENGDPFDTGEIDRAAAQAQIEALVAATVVLSDEITYLEEDPNRYQTTLDANNAPAHTKAEPATDPTWKPVELDA